MIFLFCRRSFCSREGQSSNVTLGASSFDASRLARGGGGGGRQHPDYLKLVMFLFYYITVYKLGFAASFETCWLNQAL